MTNTVGEIKGALDSIIESCAKLDARIDAAGQQQFRIKHGSDTIGYAFASTAEAALRAFRSKHNIPDAVKLAAECCTNRWRAGHT